jgi:hypothetical protein
MKELGAYTGLLYGALNIVSLISIFVFDYYEGKFGGPWENAVLNAMFVVPFVIVASSGYAFGAYFRDRKRVHPTSFRCVAVSALLTTALFYATALFVEWLVTDSPLLILAAYFGGIGILCPWVCAFQGRPVPSAA